QSPFPSPLIVLAVYGTLGGKKEKKNLKNPQNMWKPHSSPHPFLPVWNVGCRAQSSGSYFVTRRPPARGLKETGGLMEQL
ncbi:unnamed protein product, partial [Gulo gulo]